jgi:hypothetical protein
MATGQNKSNVGVKVAMKNFPHGVKYPRTTNWFNNNGDWYHISTWCTQMFGKSNWEYINQSFLFEQESHKVMFLLRWA